MIEAKRLTKRFGEVLAVDGISFEVPEGAFVSFVGPNGAGKTSLMRMIYGLADITSGELQVAGKKLPASMQEVKSLLGVVPQDSNLDHDLSVLDNLLLYARYHGIDPAVASKRAGELIEFMDLSTRADALIPELSGGMKRRLLIARALINEPALLILDEPTTGLDPKMRHIIWEKLLELKERRLTLLLTTHYMEEAEQLADIVAIMDHGSIIAMDPPSTLVERYGGSLEEVFLQLTGKELSDGE